VADSTTRCTNGTVPTRMHR